MALFVALLYVIGENIENPSIVLTAFALMYIMALSGLFATIALRAPFYTHIVMATHILERLELTKYDAYAKRGEEDPFGQMKIFKFFDVFIILYTTLTALSIAGASVATLILFEQVIVTKQIDQALKLALLAGTITLIQLPTILLCHKTKQKHAPAQEILATTPAALHPTAYIINKY